ncbi:unnamed protein product [Pipistrellus nathusii]|uniref:Protein-tyrosine-phosphatase n=1 Tax=Pipistrellus nathusii TaxID=59473 RepID=A0ABP0AHC5_PIPNA
MTTPPPPPSPPSPSSPSPSSPSPSWSSSPPLPPPPPPPRAQSLPHPLRTRELSQLTSSLYIGNAAAANNRYLLATNRITTVINISVEIINTFIEGIQYLKFPVSDSPGARIGDFFDAVADCIHAVGLRGGRTLVHCHAGISRSATVCMAFLMKHHSLSLLEAHTWTRACRPVIRPNNSFWEQLIVYEFKLFARNTVKMIDSPLGRIPDVYQKEYGLMLSL